MITITNTEHWLIEQVRNLGNKNAILSNLQSQTFSELCDDAILAASFLFNKGIRKSDHVLILIEHKLEFVILVNALWFLGAIPVPISNKSSLREIQDYINHSKSKYFIHFDNMKSSGNLRCEIIDFQLNKLDGSAGFTPIKFNPNADCLMMYTSGSTGSAKCVQFSFKNLFASIKVCDSFINHTVYDSWLASLPFNHIGGFSIITRTIACGCILILPESLKIVHIYKACLDFSPSLMSAVSINLERIINKFSMPWSKLRHIFIGGGPLSNELLTCALSKNWPVAVVYGATETTSMVTVADRENLVKFGVSAGKALYGVKIKLKNHLTINSDVINVGRIIIESESVAKSYFNYSHITEQNIQSDQYISNDLGKIDENGNLVILGRIDDIIISGGENISLIEIEMLLNQEFLNSEFVCLGIRHEKWYQSYLLITNCNLTEEIKIFLEKNLNKIKLPSSIMYLPELPKNEMGKVKKSELKKMISADFL